MSQKNKQDKTNKKDHATAVKVDNMDRSFWKNNWIKTLTLIILSISIYVQGINYEYVLDDKIVISDNDFTSAGVSGIWDILTTESMTGFFGEQKNLVAGNRYRPLSLVTFALEVEAFGKSPRAHHIGNILIYAFCCIVFFRMLHLLLAHRDKKHNTWLSMAFIASVLYTLHPTHVEAVANIKGRDEVMAMIFSCLTVTCAMQYIFKRKSIFLLGLVVSYFLGLLSKENTITFLAIVPASMYFFSKALKGDYVKVLGIMLGTTVAYLILRFSVSGVPDFSREITDIMNNPFYEMTGAQKYATISYTLLKYLGLSILPIQLSHDYYPYAIPILNWLDYRALLGLITHAGMGYLILKYWKSKSIVSYSLFFYIAALSIVSNIVINVGTFMNERFIFISTGAICLLLTYLLRDKLSAWQKLPIKNTGLGLLAALSIYYGARSFARVPAWESALTLNESAVKVSSNSARANSFMATALYNAARKEGDRSVKKDMLLKAETYAAKASNIIPRYKDGNTMKAGVAGELHGLDNDLPKLLATFKSVVSNRPDIPYVIQYLEYLQGKKITDQELVNFYYDVGYNELLNKKSNAKWAMHYLSKAYEIEKNDRNLVKAIADTYSILGEKDKAQRFYNALGQ